MQDSDLYLVEAERPKRDVGCVRRCRFGSGRVESQYRYRKWEVVIHKKIENMHLVDIADEGPSSESERPAGLRVILKI